MFYLLKRSSIRSIIIGVNIITLLLLFTITAFSLGSEMKKSARPINLDFYSGTLGGVGYTLGAIIAEYTTEIDPEINITVLPGSYIASIQIIDTKEGDIGMSSPIFYRPAMNGEEPFTQKFTSPKALGIFDGGQPSIFVLFMTRSDTGITSVEQIIENKIPLKLCVTTKGSAGEYISRRVMEECGLTYDNILEWGGEISYVTHTEAVDLIRDGHANAWFLVSGIAHGSTVELTLARDMNFLNIDPEIINTLKTKFGYTKYDVAEGTFKNQDSIVSTVTYGSLLIVREDLPDDVAYILTKAVMENAEKIKENFPAWPIYAPTAWENTLFPLHPGAEMWFREQGFMK